MNARRPAKLGKKKAGDPGYRKRIQGEAKFWDERAERLCASGRIPLWFDHRRGEDVTFIPLDELKGAGIRANPVLYRAVFGGLIDHLIRVATGKKGNVLDLGCGAGWFSLELARCGMSVDGLDSEILITAHREFSVETMESRFLFFPVLVSRLRIYRLPPMISLPLIKVLERVDRGLIRSRSFRRPFFWVWPARLEPGVEPGTEAGPFRFGFSMLIKRPI
jgi:SAM-dependent methyltransferase